MIFRGLLLALWLAVPARADVYSYTDAAGIVHFTNVPQAQGGKWRRLFKTGPGKAAARRGTCEHCDAVPARDTSPERLSRFDAHITEAASVYQIPDALIRAVIKVESDFDPRVISNVGARGLMQLMPDTQTHMGVRNPFDARENILGGTRLLRVLANRFDGDLVLTLAGYHAGAAAVEKYEGIPPYETTQQYVRQVLKNYYRYKRQ